MANERCSQEFFKGHYNPANLFRELSTATREVSVAVDKGEDYRAEQAKAKAYRVAKELFGAQL